MLWDYQFGKKKSNKNPFHTHFADLILFFVFIEVTLPIFYCIQDHIVFLLCPNILQTNSNSYRQTEIKQIKCCLLSNFKIRISRTLSLTHCQPYNFPFTFTIDPTMTSRNPKRSDNKNPKRSSHFFQLHTQSPSQAMNCFHP